MALFDDYDREVLRNTNEERVIETVQSFLTMEPKYCNCRDCRLDAAAIALNTLSPKYIVFEEHNIDSADLPTDEEIMDKVKEAYEIVHAKPHHS